ncbi:hypothetical protein [Bartonella harrusi]|uniref:Uncharacterized protein n=1 Tax=Bartonella harrusi TaxID=2961895 RepID=A0ABY5ESD7_9HYPH|nr:hypothetical protein [Bartonella harrusi]UTO28177.1 hypothetical protein NMK50_08385 [Bartonella harrusi]
MISGYENKRYGNAQRWEEEGQEELYEVDDEALTMERATALLKTWGGRWKSRDGGSFGSPLLTRSRSVFSL